MQKYLNEAQLIEIIDSVFGRQDLERKVARAIWISQNMKGGSDDWIDAARAAIAAIRDAKKEAS
jgi:hypothetical protein